MNKSIKQYIPIREIHVESAANSEARLGKVTHIELEVSYSLGGTNIFTGAPVARGYYLHATPVEIAPHKNGVSMIGFTVGVGTKALLTEVNRQSEKQLGIACTKACDMAPQLLDWCKEQYGIFCDMPEIFFPDANKTPVPKSAPKVKPRAAVPVQEAKPIRSMKLLTAEIIRKLEKHPIGSQESKGDEAKVLVKFFGGTSYTLLVTEGEKLDNGDWYLFGKATHGFGWEWGYTLLSEIEKKKFPPLGLGVEREMYLESGATVASLIA